MNDFRPADPPHHRLATLVESLTCEDMSVVLEMDNGQFHSAVLVQEDEFGAELVIRAPTEIASGSRLTLRVGDRCDPCVTRAVLHIGSSTWLDVQWNWPQL